MISRRLSATGGLPKGGGTHAAFCASDFSFCFGASAFISFRILATMSSSRSAPAVCLPALAFGRGAFLRGAAEAEFEDEAAALDRPAADDEPEPFLVDEGAGMNSMSLSESERTTGIVARRGRRALMKVKGCGGGAARTSVGSSTRLAVAPLSTHADRVHLDSLAVA